MEDLSSFTSDSLLLEVDRLSENVKNCENKNNCENISPSDCCDLISLRTSASNVKSEQNCSLDAVEKSPECNEIKFKKKREKLRHISSNQTLLCFERTKSELNKNNSFEIEEAINEIALENVNHIDDNVPLNNITDLAALLNSELSFDYQVCDDTAGELQTGVTDNHPQEENLIKSYESPGDNEQNQKESEKIDFRTDTDETSFYSQNDLTDFSTLNPKAECTAAYESIQVEVLEQSTISSGCLLWEESQPVADTVQTSSAAPEQKSLPTDTNLNLLCSWGLPSSVLQQYYKKGIKEMFEWQWKCLKNVKVSVVDISYCNFHPLILIFYSQVLLNECNLAYCAPTSAGKTLISEILTIKACLERKKKALIVLPFVSIVKEKMFYYRDLLTPAGLRVDGFYGSHNPPGGFEQVHVAICTIEKANSIVNRLLESNKLAEIGVVVVDEVHLISDPNRGYLLELLIAKIL